MSELITTVGHTTPFDVEDTPPGSTAPAALLIASPSQRDGFLDGTLAAGVLAPPDVYPAAPPVEVPYIEVPRTKRRRGGRYGWHKLQTPLEVDLHPPAPIPTALTALRALRRRGWRKVQVAPELDNHPSIGTFKSATDLPLKAIRRNGWRKHLQVAELNTRPVTTYSPPMPSFARQDAIRRRGWTVVRTVPELDILTATPPNTAKVLPRTNSFRRNGWVHLLSVAQHDVWTPTPDAVVTIPTGGRHGEDLVAILAAKKRMLMREDEEILAVMMTIL